MTSSDYLILHSRDLFSSHHCLRISEAIIIIPKTASKPPLGEILYQADLATAEQLLNALRKQIEGNKQRIGEILAAEGIIKQSTAEFFVTQWPNLLQEKRKYRLGEYLQKAALLDAGSVEDILRTQEKLGVKFGYAAVLLGLLKPKTLDFFIQHLFPEHQNDNVLANELQLVQAPTDESAKVLQTLI